MSASILSDADRAHVLDRWTTRAREAATWRDVRSMPSRVLLDVSEDRREPVEGMDAWQPAPLGPRFSPARLTHAARLDIQTRAVAAIKRAETWEALGRGLMRVAVAAAKAFGGAA